MLDRSFFTWVLFFLFASTNLLRADEFSWPQWRGPDRTGVSRETGLLESWPEGGPEQVWVFRDGGIGYAGFSVVGDRLFTMGARNGMEELICLSASTGELQWATRLGDLFENNWGDGPRATPTVDGDLVYAMGAKGNLVCAKVADGQEVWSFDLKEVGGKIPDWGYTESVLVEENNVICTPGGSEGTMLALNKLTGEKVWQSAEITDGAQYSSVIAADHNGSRQLIQLTQKSLFAADAANGKLLWKVDWPGAVAVIPTPIFKDGHVYATSGYGTGCNLYKIGEDNQVTEIYPDNTKIKKLMKNHHGGVVLTDGHVYGYSDGAGWLCQNFESGEQVWRDRNSLGKGAIVAVDNKLVMISENEGEVVMIDASTDGWNEKGRFTLEPQSELRKPAGRIWVHPVIVNGKMYLRDQEIVHCYNVGAPAE